MPKAYEAGELVAGKYLLRDKLGEGGMGAVWRAYNETLEVEVALKLIRSEEMLASDGAHLGDRLLQEARAAARLGHPAIARVFDFGTTDRGDPYIVMELLKGEDLANALAVAHATGIVHRDLKPENIFLARAEDGRVQPKLVDFGIAKIERKNKNNRLTQTGTMLGSPIYMSPEQARGDDVDHLADVWAICVVLYEMITGRPPFEGKNYNALLYSIIADEPPAATSFGAGDDELWLILRRGFEKDPDKRWQSIRELGENLARWLVARGSLEDITGASISAQWLRELNYGDVLTSMLPGAGEVILMPQIPRSTKLLVEVAEQHLPQDATFAAKPRFSPLFRVALLSLLFGIVGVAGAARALHRPKLAADAPRSELATESLTVAVFPMLEASAQESVAPLPANPPAGVRAVAVAPDQVKLRKFASVRKPDLAVLPKAKLKDPFEAR